jgi:cell wall-associated NlpC family hydrolase
MPRTVPVLLSALCAAAVGVFGLTVSEGVAGAAVVSHNPRGHADGFALTGSSVAFNGWAFDPDTAGTVRIVVTVDGTPTGSVLADHSRPDIGHSFPAQGNNRGYQGTLALPPGTHAVCLRAGDLALGSDTTLGCKTFVVPIPAGKKADTVPLTRRPIGYLDTFSFANSRLTVQGWTMDPDDSSALQVDVMVNGQSYGAGTANLVRADVARAYPNHGANHGYAFSMPAALAPGNYELCVVGVNSAAGGNSILPCKVLSVRGAGDPATLGSATASQAADAIQAQAILSGAARRTDFVSTASAASRIATATRALLQQAAGRSSRPPAVAGVPGFVAATPTKAVDEQAVMGSTPYLGSYPASKTGGRAGTARSLQVYAADALTPPGGAGVGLIGAAPVLVPNGRTVHPTLPAYQPGYTKLRAEVAIDAALAHLGDPYVWAAAGASTFDCSGLTQWAWAKAGVSLAHYTGSQAVQGVRVRPNQLLPGDLVLFGGDLHHVGLYLGAGYMLDAPDTGSYVRVDKISWFGDFSLAVRP